QSRVLRAPQLKVLQRMEPQDILDALEVGNMRFQGVQRTREERRAIAEFITGKSLEQADELEQKQLLAGRCPVTSKFAPAGGPQWNGWGAGLDNARFQSAEQAQLTADQVAKLNVKWAFGFPPNAVLSQPAVV